MNARFMVRWLNTIKPLFREPSDYGTPLLLKTPPCGVSCHLTCKCPSRGDTSYVGTLLLWRWGVPWSNKMFQDDSTCSTLWWICSKTCLQGTPLYSETCLQNLSSRDTSIQWNMSSGDTSIQWNLSSGDTSVQWNLSSGDTSIQWNLSLGDTSIQ